MPVAEGIAKFTSRLCAALRSETDAWQNANQDALAQLDRDPALAEQEVRREMALLAVRFHEERRRLEMEEADNTRHFSEFLDSIDEVKENLLTYYTALPLPLAVLIHHHAAELLKEAWHSPSARERLKRQTRFTELMLAITEDLAALARDGEGGNALPERTLARVRKARGHLPLG